MTHAIIRNVAAAAAAQPRLPAMTHRLRTIDCSPSCRMSVDYDRYRYVTECDVIAMTDASIETSWIERHSSDAQHIFIQEKETHAPRVCCRINSTQMLTIQVAQLSQIDRAACRGG